MRIFRTIFGIIFSVCCQSVIAQGFNDSACDIVQQDRYAKLFQSGDTNTPLLTMDWFSRPRVDEFCQVSRSGKISSARNVINWAIQGGHRGQLDQTNLESLILAMNDLPQPPKVTPPQERWLVVRGIRTNQWFKYIYDRSNVPKEVEKLYEITGAYLEWSIPEVKGQQIVHSEYGNYHTSQAGIASFSVASAAPIAVSSGVNGIQIWDLDRGTAKPLIFLKSIPDVDFESSMTVAVISPDGNIIAFASNYATYAVDWRAEKILWKGNPLARLGEASRLNKEVAIGGDKGQFLFVAGTGSVERWDLATGKILAVLATNQPTIKFLNTSRDGKILVAGFDDSTFMDTMCVSFTVWKADQDNPASHIDEPERTGVAISPDGRRIALSVFGQKGLKIWNWQSGAVKEVPLRTPYASSRAYSMNWSPDKTKFVAYVDTYPESIVVYDALTWKPLAHWQCGQLMSDAKFDFENNGEFVELRDHDVSGLDVTAIKGLSN